MLDQYLTPELLSAWRSLTTPRSIQDYLDEAIKYDHSEEDRSPLEVMQTGRAHCLDGGIFAAAALRRLGYPPLLVDLTPEPGRDDDHVLAVFRQRGCWGVVAKSNFAGMRFREPVYRSLRELAMSFFDTYFNMAGEYTLRGYTRPLNLTRFDRFGWLTSQEGVKHITRRLYTLKIIPLLTPEAAAELHLLDHRKFRAYSSDTDTDNVFQVE